jgi:hypothetical protein
MQVVPYGTFVALCMGVMAVDLTFQGWVSAMLCEGHFTIAVS